MVLNLNLQTDVVDRNKQTVRSVLNQFATGTGDIGTGDIGTGDIGTGDISLRQVRWPPRSRARAAAGKNKTPVSFFGWGIKCESGSFNETLYEEILNIATVVNPKAFQTGAAFVFENWSDIVKNGCIPSGQPELWFWKNLIDSSDGGRIQVSDLFLPALAWIYENKPQVLAKFWDRVDQTAIPCLQGGLSLIVSGSTSGTSARFYLGTQAGATFRERLWKWLQKHLMHISWVHGGRDLLCSIAEFPQAAPSVPFSLSKALSDLLLQTPHSSAGPSSDFQSALASKFGSSAVGALRETITLRVEREQARAQTEQRERERAQTEQRERERVRTEQLERARARTGACAIFDRQQRERARAQRRAQREQHDKSGPADVQNGGADEQNGEAAVAGDAGGDAGRREAGPGTRTDVGDEATPDADQDGDGRRTDEAETAEQTEQHEAHGQDTHDDSERDVAPDDGSSPGPAGETSDHVPTAAEPEQVGSPNHGSERATSPDTDPGQPASSQHASTTADPETTSNQDDAASNCSSHVVVTPDAGAPPSAADILAAVSEAASSSRDSLHETAPAAQGYEVSPHGSDYAIASERAGSDADGGSAERACDVGEAVTATSAAGEHHAESDFEMVPTPSSLDMNDDSMIHADLPCVVRLGGFRDPMPQFEMEAVIQSLWGGMGHEGILDSLALQPDATASSNWSAEAEFSTELREVRWVGGPGNPVEKIIFIFSKLRQQYECCVIFHDSANARKLQKYLERNSQHRGIRVDRSTWSFDLSELSDLVRSTFEPTVDTPLVVSYGNQAHEALHLELRRLLANRTCSQQLGEFYANLWPNKDFMKDRSQTFFVTRTTPREFAISYCLRPFKILDVTALNSKKVPVVPS